MGTEQTPRTFSDSMQRDRVTHAAKCSSSQSIIRELFRGREKELTTGKNKEAQSVVASPCHGTEGVKKQFY